MGQKERPFCKRLSSMGVNIWEEILMVRHGAY